MGDIVPTKNGVSFLCEPNSPIRRIVTEPRPMVYSTGDPLMMEPTEYDVTITMANGATLRDAVEYICDYLGIWQDDARPTRVLVNDIATIVFWSDGTKSVTKRREGDRNNHELALLNCYWRHRERNRGRSDAHYEDNVRIGRLVDEMRNTYEMRDVAKCLEFLADAYDIEAMEG